MEVLHFDGLLELAVAPAFGLLGDRHGPPLKRQVPRHEQRLHLLPRRSTPHLHLLPGGGDRGRAGARPGVWAVLCLCVRDGRRLRRRLRVRTRCCCRRPRALPRRTRSQLACRPLDDDLQPAPFPWSVAARVRSNGAWTVHPDSPPSMDGFGTARKGNPPPTSTAQVLYLTARGLWLVRHRVTLTWGVRADESIP